MTDHALIRTPAPLPGPPASLDQVAIRGLHAWGYHGVFEHERRDGQDFYVDVVLHLDTRAAAATDDLELTVNYGTLAEAVAAEIAGEPVDLIETLAARIADVALQPIVHCVDVTVHKPQAPVSVPVADIAVTIRRFRDVSADVAASPASS